LAPFPAGGPPRLLIVDDEESFIELCMDILQEEGYAIDQARNGKEALALLEKKEYQVVVSDINMPVMGGIDLLKTAKPSHPDVEFILMTAFGGLQSALEALRFGAYDYITKPFTRDWLLVTIRRCLEKQRLTLELRAAQGELIKKEKLAALGAMAGWLAHRMRNPLNVILMCSQYLKSKFPGGDERLEVAMAIEDKGKALEKMIRDFIEFSRTYQPVLRPESLPGLLEQVLGNFTSRCRIQKVEVRKEFAGDIPPVPLDHGLMEEVLDNIMNNALEAMDGPGTLTLKARPADGRVLIDIANSGAPIDPELVEKVFDPFFTTKERGTGLGLAIARKVVESHGGTIGILSGAETTLHIELPLSAQPSPGAPA
jgi:signal transduction histidine kinase